MINLKIPAVLLVTFNRPEYTKAVIARLRECAIPRLYVFNDGPRSNNLKDIEARKAIQILLKGIDWECELSQMFSDSNLGCGKGVSTAISWAFEKEESLIILEDDCVPSPAFFPYCSDLLERYRDDNRVWIICGENHNYPDWSFRNGDYVFSQFGFNCGWATWKRCWKHFDIKMSKLPDFLDLNLLESVFPDSRMARTFLKNYQRISVQLDKPSFWTAQFGFAMLSNRGYCIIPRENLIVNIGETGDHTIGLNKYLNVSSSTDFRIKRHPAFVLADKKVESFHFNARIKPMIEGRPLIARIHRRVKRLLLCK